MGSDVYVEIGAFLRRWYWRLRREPVSIFAALAEPVLWLFLFGNLFRGAGVAAEAGGDYLAFMTAGVVVMTVVNAALAGGIEVMFDREQGLLPRFLAAPIRPASVLVGRFLFVVIVTSLQAGVILAMARLMGVRPATGLPGVAGVLAIGVLLGAGIAVLSLSLAFRLRTHGEFFELIAFVSLPLLFLSSALVPLDAMPGWMAAVARLNPMTYAIDAVRSLMLHGWVPGLLAGVAGVLVLFDAACLAIGVRTFSRAMRD
ncbi:ABC transporter permease [Geochorda subterranea]|uniref:Transport permease protein n=1 Tax=Geochorda subterranea TaxID=3109564 RepID=A0ABZ1BRJ2_9FIRM|nr:ABC transporter permease [Limnochorda sp. LNt]WRP15432.1 ABC transporter permease [Limnochorda sp. LNt]